MMSMCLAYRGNKARFYYMLSENLCLTRMREKCKQVLAQQEWKLKNNSSFSLGSYESWKTNFCRYHNKELPTTQSTYVWVSVYLLKLLTVRLLNIISLSLPFACAWAIAKATPLSQGSWGFALLWLTGEERSHYWHMQVIWEGTVYPNRKRLSCLVNQEMSDFLKG